MKRYYIIVSGRVQGVGFRYFCLKTARQCQLTGWVKNQTNGTVALEVQGKEANLSLFIQTLRQGDRFIRVDDYQIKQLELADDNDFKIRY
ncbi:MAG: acylphosphatase [Eubacterium sp.]|nr:acylphosphatase [Eubacterium sp.]